MQVHLDASVADASCEQSQRWLRTNVAVADLARGVCLRLDSDPRAVDAPLQAGEANADTDRTCGAVMKKWGRTRGRSGVQSYLSLASLQMDIAWLPRAIKPWKD